MAISEELVDNLNRLMRLSQDAADVYRSAIEKLSVDDLASSLRVYRDEHREQAKRLARLIVSFGAQTRTGGRTRGFSLSNVTLLPALASTEDVLQALRDDEAIVNDRFREALDDRVMGDEARDVLAFARARNARHLQWIDHALETRVWDTDIETVTGVSLERPQR